MTPGFVCVQLSVTPDMRGHMKINIEREWSDMNEAERDAAFVLLGYAGLTPDLVQTGRARRWDDIVSAAILGCAIGICIGVVL